jgi:GT2 family glycosyltransferase
MGATVLPALADVDPRRFLPSSRSVLFSRAAWRAVGGYPEWLDYGEDVVFDLALRRAGFRFGFAPEAVASFRPRGSLNAFVRQYFLYARGDGKAGLWWRRHAVRYGVYLGASLSLWRWRWRATLPLLLGAVLYCRRPLERLRPHLAGLTQMQIAYAVLLVPVLRGAGDLAKMAGYPLGVIWRLRRSWT